MRFSPLHADLRAALVAAAMAWAGQAIATDAGAPDITPGNDLTVRVPSGQTVTLQDVVWNVPGTDGLATRFRFVAPGIAPGGGVDFDAAAADMQHLCDDFALPRVKDNAPPPAQIVISLADRPIPFGEAAPDATQFFESYRIENGSCQWEMF